jgi:hypothetical protein
VLRAHKCGLESIYAKTARIDFLDVVFLKDEIIVLLIRNEPYSWEHDESTEAATEFLASFHLPQKSDKL